MLGLSLYEDEYLRIGGPNGALVRLVQTEYAGGRGKARLVITAAPEVKIDRFRPDGTQINGLHAGKVDPRVREITEARLARGG